VQLWPEVDKHPVHVPKLFPLTVAGAVSVTLVPETYVKLSGLDPFESPRVSSGDALIATPLAGFVVATVRV
jgi:hypothetical protein